MRAARLLHMLLLLQNRGRLTTADLAGELEVSRRTILRDIDALTEAGLPVISHQGNRGGIELGFNYRTRLTGLDESEAEAIGVILSMRHSVLDTLGIGSAVARAQSKLFESFPDKTRAHMEAARDRYDLAPAIDASDPRVAALAQALRDRAIVRVRTDTADATVIHPVAMRLAQNGWSVRDSLTGAYIPQKDWGRINISARRFAASPGAGEAR